MRFERQDRRVTIQRYTESQNSYGEPVKTWADVVTTWASKRDVSGKEEFRGDERIASVDTVFRIRYRTGITPEMRIACAGDYYDIKVINEIGRKEYLELQTQAIRV